MCQRDRLIRTAMVLVAFSRFPTVAQAADPALNVGAIEVVALPDGEHVGVYPYAAVSLAFPVGNVVIIPSVGLEYSPELGRGGFVGGLVLDVPVTSTIGVDFLISAIHDQPGTQWTQAIFYLGGGAGVSITAGPIVVSPFVALYGGVNVAAWSIVPGLNVAYVFQEPPGGQT
jgi:hypothetical protein